MNIATRPEKLTPKDYASDQEVRWCPGCGDYAIVRSMQTALAQMQAPLEKTVYISGIGCAARFPYYMSTYGFHTIHGRAAAIATGADQVSVQCHRENVRPRRRGHVCGQAELRGQVFAVSE